MSDVFYFVLKMNGARFFHLPVHVKCLFVLSKHTPHTHATHHTEHPQRTHTPQHNRHHHNTTHRLTQTDTYRQTQTKRTHTIVFVCENDKIKMLGFVTLMKVNSGIARDAFTQKVALSGPRFVDYDWHAFCQALYKGIEGEDWRELLDAYKEMSRDLGVKKPQEAQKAKALWKMKAAKDPGEEYYDPTREDNILGRNKTRSALWKEHLKASKIRLWPWIQR